MGVEHGALERSLRGLSLGVIRDVEREKAKFSDVRLQEGRQEFQVPIQGTAYQGVVWGQVALKFDFVFHNATGQRDSPYTRPQFTYGVVIEKADKDAPAVPIIVSCLCEYDVDERESTRGAVIHVGVHSPTATPRDFEGFLHVTFSGYGAQLEDESADST